MQGAKSDRPTDIQDRTFAFGVRTCKFVDRLPRTRTAEVLGRQLIRSGTSVGANVQEADGAESHKDFVHKIAIARKEAQESEYWLKVIQATVPDTNPELSTLRDEANQLARILYAIAHPKRQQTQ